MAVRKQNGMTKRERSWVVYDVGNSAFVMLSSTLIPIYFASLADPESSVVVAWGYAETVAALVLALVMPFLGSIADVMGYKKKFLAGTIGTGVVACAALGIPSSALAFLAIYVVASIMLNGSMVFYDSFLTDATTPDRFNKISSAGYAWGYIGSCIPFVACLAIVLGGPAIGISTAVGMKAAFAITALWWLAFSIPILKNVRQVHGKPREKRMFANAIAGLGHTIGDIAKNKRLLLFVVAYFFYIDGVHTIIRMSTSYGTDLGLDATQLVLALLVTQIVAFPAVIIYGNLAGRFGSLKMIMVSVAAYFLIVLYAAICLHEAWQFWILAISVGLFQGGIQALSRSYFGRIIPAKQSNEYFGFFDIFGKYAAVLGTFLVSFFAMITGNPSVGVASLAVLFAVAFLLLAKLHRMR